MLGNFYRYLLYHDVCPEYTEQLNEARQVCDIANRELLRAVEVARYMPDQFASSCSILYEGNLANTFSSGQTWDGAEDVGLTKDEAWAVLVSAVGISGTDDQCAAMKDGGVKAVCLGDRELQVTGVEPADAEMEQYYEECRLKIPHLQKLGRLHCRRLNADLTAAALPVENFTFWISEDVLQHCFMGMKIEATVYQLNIGIMWIDTIRAVNASYFVVVANEFYDKEEDAVIPKGWYKRQRTIKAEGRRAVDGLGKLIEVERAIDEIPEGADLEPSSQITEIDES